VWFRQIIRAVTDSYGLHYQLIAKPIRRDTDFAFGGARRFRIEKEKLGHRTFRGSHVIRDPRDLVVSGYEYHKTTKEEWCLRPNPWREGGRSYQQELLSLDEHDGLMSEIDFMARNTAPKLAEWDYEQPEFIELRYEDAIADELGTFEKLFRWYGFNETAITMGLDAAERLSLRRGGAAPNHARSGAPGEWRNRLSPDHIARFKELTGDLVVRLGYEVDGDW
jgi:hypothetical protein